MPVKSTVNLGVAISLLMAPFFVSFFWGWNQAKAQPDRFLVSPYFGVQEINSHFDHEYPTYDDYPNNSNRIFTRYDGQRWINTDINNCINGENCYDGHDGIDFGVETCDTITVP